MGSYRNLYFLSHEQKTPIATQLASRFNEALQAKLGVKDQTRVTLTSIDWNNDPKWQTYSWLGPINVESKADLAWCLCDDQSQWFAQLIPALKSPSDYHDMSQRILTPVLASCFEQTLNTTQIASKKFHATKWFGRAIASFTLSHQAQLHCLLPLTWLEKALSIQAKPSTTVNIESLSSACDNQSTSLTVELPRFRLTVGELQNLTVGDCLSTQVSLETPFIVKSSQTAIAECYIGKQKNHKAVVLTGKA
ncbi:MAG: FliM/FliN family flagellar motor C-terminal domain-containing protein [Pseudomonadota bacterium]